MKERARDALEEPGHDEVTSVAMGAPPRRGRRRMGDSGDERQGEWVSEVCKEQVRQGA
jgi:hypothetical protein